MLVRFPEVHAGYWPVLIVAVGLLAGGCAVDMPFLKDKGSGETDAVEPAAAGEETETEAPQVYYVGVENLRLYSEPAFSQDYVADLKQYQKVYRDKLEKGFARVKVDGSELSGWVDNAKLIWRLPQQDGGEQAAPADAGSVSETGYTVDTDADEAEAKPAATTEPAGPGVDPSRFDPF